jgi:hypothetical protein
MAPARSDFYPKAQITQMAVQKMQVVVQKTTFPQTARAGRLIRRRIRTRLPTCRSMGFGGAPNASAPHGSNGSTLSMAEIDDFISDSDGLRPIRAFVRIDNAAVRRRIVMLVQEIAGDDD